MSLRADFLAELQRDERLHDVSLKVEVPPLREGALREVVRKPAELLSARIDDDLVEVITRRTAEDSARNAGALPLLSYTLDDMWKQMVAREDGVLRLAAASFEPGGVLVDRADGFLAAHPEAEETLRRLLTLKLATVREGEEPTRRRAPRSEFMADEWRLICSLADQPNRLLVVATSDGGETYAEVAHEAVFRRWQKLREWIAAERGFLAWRTGLEAARRHWQNTPDAMRPEALLMGVALTQAQRWFASRRDDLSDPDHDFVGQSLAREARRRSRGRRGQALVYALLVGIIVALVGAVFKADIEEAYWWHWVMARYASARVTPHVLTAEAERALRRHAFKTCDITFAVSKFEVTFDDWDACVAVHGCPKEGRANDSSFGRVQRVMDLQDRERIAVCVLCAAVPGSSYRATSARPPLLTQLRRPVRQPGLPGRADAFTINP